MYVEPYAHSGGGVEGRVLICGLGKQPLSDHSELKHLFSKVATFPSRMIQVDFCFYF